MRTLALFLLLAGTAVPALAAADDHERGGPRAERSDDNDRAERRQQAERSSNDEGPRQRRFERQSAEPSSGDSNPWRARREAREQAVQQQQQQVLQQQQQEQIQQRREARRQQVEQQATQEQQAPVMRQRNDPYNAWARRRIQEQQGVVVQPGVQEQQRVGDGDRSGWRERQREIRTIPGTQIDRSVMRGPERPRSTIERRYRDRDNHQWSQHWRGDRRYDWRRHRDRNRSIFRIGFYYDPFGWGYNRFRVGSYLWPSYYSNRYWINDPWQYRLPEAWGPYRWVRYHNDALLIDTWTGEVVDVIYGFFW